MSKQTTYRLVTGTFPNFVEYGTLSYHKGNPGDVKSDRACITKTGELPKVYPFSPRGLPENGKGELWSSHTLELQHMKVRQVGKAGSADVEAIYHLQVGNRFVTWAEVQVVKDGKMSVKGIYRRSNNPKTSRLGLFSAARQLLSVTGLNHVFSYGNHANEYTVLDIDSSTTSLVSFTATGDIKYAKDPAIRPELEAYMLEMGTQLADTELCPSTSGIFVV